MKLIRRGSRGADSPHVRINAGTRIDVNHVVQDFDRLFFASEVIRSLDPVVSARLSAGDVLEFGYSPCGSPIAHPRQIVRVGVHDLAHARESGHEEQSESILVLKSTTTIVEPNDDVTLLRRRVRTAGEFTMGVVIGSKASCVDSFDDARDVVAGFMTVNDVSDRSSKLARSGPWSKGKSAEMFNPTASRLATLAGLSIGHSAARCVVSGHGVDRGIEGLGVQSQRNTEQR